MSVRPGGAMRTSTPRPLASRALVALLLFVAVGALGGGGIMLFDRSGAAAGLDVGLLARTPFTSYLGPGILLTFGLGVVPLATAVGVVRRMPSSPFAGLERRTGRHWSWTASMAFGLALMAWIAVQVMLIDLSWLQPLMFVTGGAITALALTPSVRRDLAVGADAAPGRDAIDGSRDQTLTPA